MKSFRNGKVVMPINLTAVKSKKEPEKVIHPKPPFESDKPDTTTRSLKQSFDLINLCGVLLGWRLGFELKNSFRFCFHLIFITFTWAQILYSQFKFAANGEPRRIFEVFALYGIAISVSKRREIVFETHCLQLSYFHPVFT